ncbi:MAG: FAD-binding protein [Alistipes sp.]|nr:FAD-binding protein [Alistipes sp.]
MPLIIPLVLSPRQSSDPDVYVPLAARAAGVPERDVALARVVKKSVDARRRPVRVHLTVELYVDGEPEPEEVDFRYGDVSGRREAVVIGAGPAGLFAALRLIERGYRPVILERGKPVAERKKDIAAINRNLGLDPDSNYAFGEGGAGTFSDGKLYTRSKKRGDYNRALHILVRHGAPPEILYEAHPHIGTDRLPGVITRIRETIEACGGEVIFGARVTGIDVRDGHVAAVRYVRTGSGGAGVDNAASAEDTPGRTGTTRHIASSGITEKKGNGPTTASEIPPETSAGAGNAADTAAPGPHEAGRANAAYRGGNHTATGPLTEKAGTGEIPEKTIVNKICHESGSRVYLTDGAGEVITEARYRCGANAGKGSREGNGTGHGPKYVAGDGALYGTDPHTAAGPPGGTAHPGSSGEYIIETGAAIMATGHSARDVYEMLHARGLRLEPKDFAMGVRIEHPQALIDSIQYHVPERGPYLSAASYSLVEQVGGRGVYSFCMCPGGFIVPAMTAADESVVNGMSPSGRNSPYANSGIVTQVRQEDLAHLQDRYGVMAGLEFQRRLEQEARRRGGDPFRAPAQRVGDFVAAKPSSGLPSSSYVPGLTPSVMDKWLPGFMAGALRRGIEAFGRRLRGFVTNEALVAGVESRTSTPVRIPRDPATLMHPQAEGLYPAGEGAGYAGGIISAAMDGERTADALADRWDKR